MDLPFPGAGSQSSEEPTPAVPVVEGVEVAEGEAVEAEAANADGPDASTETGATDEDLTEPDA